jgi:hypothetical protein
MQSDLLNKGRYIEESEIDIKIHPMVLELIEKYGHLDRNLYPNIIERSVLEVRRPFKFDDGRIYTGEWNKNLNLIEGYGQTILQDGSYSEAYF